jgi:predicted ATPase
LEAEELLKQAQLGQIKLSPKGYHQATLLVSGSIEQAEDAHNAAVQRALRNKESVGETI